MVHFPPWVTAKHGDGSEESRRVRYLVMLAAVHSTPNGSIAALADTCGIDRPQVHASIREGRCSPKMALKIERACGRNVVRREWLMFPHEIEEMTQ
jgi:hypothetical protein